MVKILYLCGNIIGVIGYFALKNNFKIKTAICYDELNKQMLSNDGVICYNTIKKIKADEYDLIVSIHGREIISQEIINNTKMKIGINLHPYLYEYKGADPIGRAIKDKNWNASVGCHKMIDKLDAGEVICELKKIVIPSEERAEIYNQLYPLYIKVLKKSLKIILK